MQIEELQKKINGTFNRIDHCNLGHHHVYDDQGNAMSLKEAKEYLSSLISDYVGGVIGEMEVKTSDLKSNNPLKYVLRKHAVTYRNNLRKEQLKRAGLSSIEEKHES